MIKVHNTEYNKIRLGSPNDGGYVIVDLPLEYDLYIGAGVNDDVNFDNDFVKTIKCSGDYLLFDGTINGLPANASSKLKFTKKNISTVESNETTTLVIESYGKKNVFLKMDIEGHEYQWFNCLPESILKTFSQIVIEVHGLGEPNGWHSTPEVKKAAFKILFKHFNIVHAHGNTHSYMASIGGGLIPNTLELTLLRKGLGNQTPAFIQFPVDRDMSCRRGVPDYRFSSVDIENYFNKILGTDATPNSVVSVEEVK